MKTITISTENSETYSSISNFFIDYYMTEANGEFVKVYLYLIRLLNKNSDITVAEIADHFNLTENDICRAIKYWISRDVLKLNYDGKGHLRGIVLLPLHAPVLDLKPETDAVSILRASSYEEEPEELQPKAKKKTDTPAPQVVASEDANTELSAPNKPSFTSKDISSAREDADFSDIIYLIETLFGKPVSQTDINTIMYIYETLGFSVSLFEYLIEYCVEMGKKNCRYMESVAIAWYNDNIKTRQEAKEQSVLVKGIAKVIYKSLGIRRQCPTDTEIAFINTWTKDFAFSQDIIKKACDDAILLKPNSANFPYVNGILENWHKNNVRTLEDVNRLNQLHASKQANKSNTSANTVPFSSYTKKNQFNDFNQSTSDQMFDDMQKQLLKEVNQS